MISSSSFTQDPGVNNHRLLLLLAPTSVTALTCANWLRENVVPGPESQASALIPCRAGPKEQ